jgi:CHASE2 domain-containing sensor protein
MKKFFALKPIAITLLVFIIMFGLSFIPVNCGFLSPLSNALGDFDVYDIVYSRLLEEQTVDTNIVLVNIGSLSRRELADQINVLNKFQPAVIGIDALFESPKDPKTDSLLSSSLSNCRHLVMVDKLDDFNENTKLYGTLHSSLISFSRYSSGGFANLPNDDAVNFRTIREFRPKEKVKDSVALSFSAKISGLYKQDALKNLLTRNNHDEIINYRGNYNRFYFIDTYQYADPSADFSFIKDKIVLMGYMGPDINTKTLEDVFFTPLNERYAGKSFPDMYGIVIHANIVSMILNGNYVNLMPTWISILLAVIICFLNVKMLMYICSRWKDWFSGLTKLFIFIFTILNLFLSLEILHYLNYRINLTVALIAIVLGNTAMEIYDNYINKIFHKFKKQVVNNETE